MVFDLIGQQVKNFFVDSAGILADMQKVMIVGGKTGDIGTILENFEFAAFVVMQILTYFEMMHRLIHTDRDRVIFHNDITTCQSYCLHDRARKLQDSNILLSSHDFKEF